MKPLKFTLELGEKRTRDGRRARVICIDRENDRYPVVALVRKEDGGEYVGTFTSAGSAYQNSFNVLDLQDLPSQQTLYLNIFSGSGGKDPASLRGSIEAAKAYIRSDTNYAGTLELTFEDDRLIGASVIDIRDKP